MVLEMIRKGRLVLLSEAMSIKTTQRGSRVIRLKSTKIRWFSCWLGGRLDQLSSGRSRAVFSQAKAKGEYQVRVHSDQMVLVIHSQTGGSFTLLIYSLKVLKSVRKMLQIRYAHTVMEKLVRGR
jgi:hypothetical protein